MTIVGDPRDLLPPDCDTSTVDVLQVLHARVLRLDGEDPDHFLLSKGHNPMGYYAVLAANGRLDPDLLGSYGEWDCPLGHHPDRLLIPAVEMSSRSVHGDFIGHGRAARGRHRPWRVGPAPPRPCRQGRTTTDSIHGTFARVCELITP